MQCHWVLEGATFESSVTGILEGATFESSVTGILEGATFECSVGFFPCMAGSPAALVLTMLAAF
jgi:hypothetical protein